MTFWLFLALPIVAPVFPEQTPRITEACQSEAVAENSVTADDGVYKCNCSRTVEQDLWNYLTKEITPSCAQTSDSGVWLSHTFPMGVCLKNIVARTTPPQLLV